MSLVTQVGHSPIGVFDSGYGGLTILREIRQRLPEYDYLYLGDNARAPYGTRSFDVVYDFTLEAVKYLFSQGCQLVVLACNTASAKALRTIQQNDLDKIDSRRRVLGVIRPTVEQVGDLSKSRHVGILATPGTISSHSYKLEIAKLYPDIRVEEQACPMWVPLVENREAESAGADYFVKKYIDELLSRDESVDTVLLACTHYPLLISKIKQYMPEHINIVSQGSIVAESLADYLDRHSDMADRCSKGGECCYLTTENVEKFDELASLFLGQDVAARHVDLTNRNE